MASASGGAILDGLGADALLVICAVTCVIGAAVTCVIGAAIILPLIGKAREEGAGRS